MQLKKPTPCCGSPTLAWDKVKWNFVCPCGKMRADELGRQIDTTFAGGRRPGAGRPKKGEKPVMLAQTNGNVAVRDPDFLDRYGLEGLE